jgi:putative DNA primase/helicase
MGRGSFSLTPVSGFDRPVTTDEGHTPKASYPLANVLHAFQNGTYQAQIEKLRPIYHQYGKESAAYKKAKNTLPHVAFNGIYRYLSKDGFMASSGLIQGDHDDLNDVAGLRARYADDPHCVYAFVSPSGAGLKVGIRVVPLPIDTDTYRTAWVYVASHYQKLFGVTWDKACKDVSRTCFVSWDPDLYVNYDAIEMDLTGLGWECWLATMGDHPAGTGFHDPMMRAAASYARLAAGDRDAFIQAVEVRLKEANWDRDVSNRFPSEVEAAIDSALAKYATTDAHKRRNGQHPPPLTDLPLSDTTNAYKLVERHGEDLRYCFLFKKWIVWYRNRWSLDDTGQVMRWAKDTVKALAHTIDILDDKKAIQELFRHIKTSLATPKLKAMIESAQSELPVSPDDLDTDRWLWNCHSGTVDLRTGELRPHQRGDLITKLAPVMYDPDAMCPTWLTFLDRIMAGDVDLIRFLQKAIGYALTGDTREQCLFLLYGVGANGKSTLIDTLLALLGDYAKQAEFTTFLQRQYDTVRNDIAALRGARFVSEVEAGDGRRFAEPLLKLVTGGDTIRARFLYQEEFEYKPQFKLFLATNHKPNIKGTDHAIWRRIRLVPFTVTIPEAEQDQELPARLREELSGILTWAVEGCLAWQEEGLGIPAVVKAATDDYRNEMDIVGQFLDERCLFDPSVSTQATTLYTAFKTWCQQSGEQELTQTAFGLRLKERGYQPEKTSGLPSIFT